MLADATLYDSLVDDLVGRLVPVPEEPAMTLADWTRRRRATLKEGVPLDLAPDGDHKYLVAPYACEAPEQVYYKAGQVGVSELMINEAFWSCDERNATSLYVFPTTTHITDFSRARVGPAIEASPHLQMIVGGNGRYGTDQVGLKRVGDRFLYFRGARVDADGKAPQLKSIDADVLFLDEIDEMDARAPEIAKKRLGHSLLAEIRWASTPSFAGTGIHTKWNETDQREWVIRCDSCGQRQMLTIDMVVIEWDDLDRPVAWHGQGDGRAFAACRRCGAELDRTQPGEWVARYPDRALVGWHITKLFAARTPLASIVENLDTVDETKRRECYNQDLAEPYVPRGGALSDDVLDGLRRDYAHAKPVSGERTYVGIDVGKVLNVIIRGAVDAESGEWPLRLADQVGSFAEAGRVCRKFDAKSIVVDYDPEPRKAREFQTAFPQGVVWLADYVTVKDRDPVRWDYRSRIAKTDRTRTLDTTYAEWYAGEDVRRTLPADAREIPDYYDQLRANVRVTEKTRTGEEVARWVETGPDHYSHAENYCTIARMRPKVQAGKVG